MFKKLDEEIKLAHIVVDLVYCPNKITSVTLLGWSVVESDIQYAQMRLNDKKKEEWKSQPIENLNDRLVESLCHLKIINSLYKKLVDNQPF